MRRSSVPPSKVDLEPESVPHRRGHSKAVTQALLMLQSAITLLSSSPHEQESSPEKDDASSHSNKEPCRCAFGWRRGDKGLDYTCGSADVSCGVNRPHRHVVVLTEGSPPLVARATYRSPNDNVFQTRRGPNAYPVLADPGSEVSGWIPGGNKGGGLRPRDGHA